MPHFECNGFGEFNKLFGKHMRAKKRALRQGVKNTVKAGEKIVVGNLPEAFGDLRRGLSSDILTGPQGEDDMGTTHGRIIVDAPHAAAVEVGSRPHMPPLEPILAWVKLRASQGISGGGRGPTTRMWAKHVRMQMRGYEVRASRQNNSGRYTPVDAPEKLAKSIQMAIAKGGTAPQWYMRKSLPEVAMKLFQELSIGVQKL